MAKINSKNERIKYEYSAYLKEAKRMSAESVKEAMAAIALFEKSTKNRDFSVFHIDQARRFKRLLSEAISSQSGKPLSKATIHSRLNALKAFFLWLATQPGYKSKINYSDCDYFNPSAHDTRIATARKEVKVPTIDQIKYVISGMPSETLMEQRDRAIVAFTLLSGARDNATASFNLGHIDLARRTVFHDASTVRTKARKTFTSTFFPVGEDIEQIVADWVHTLRADCMFAETDPLFPQTRVGLNDRGDFAPEGLLRKHWANADPIRKLFRLAFEAAGLPYFNPHSVRNTLAQLGQRVCRTPEEMKAWSQNLGHEEMMTTWTSYGKLDSHRQREVLLRLYQGTEQNVDTDADPNPEIVQWVLNYLQRLSK